jgi:FkbM family methyltransferase
MRRIFKALTNPYFAMYAKAKKFILKYEGFSYDFDKNGEKRLFEKLENFKINTIFDVGANVGGWTEIALQKLPKSTIHSFEISKKTFQTLRTKHGSNHRVSLNNFGLSNENGEFEYKDYGENSGVNSLIVDADFHDKSITPVIVKATVETGDHYCKRNDIQEIDILKIDVEGAEHLVLGGFSEMLENGLIKLIQFEYGYTHGDAKFLIKDFYKLLEGYGYLLGPLKPTGVLFMDFDYALNDFNSGPNYIAVHKNQKEMIEAVEGKSIKGFPRRH